MTVYGFLSTYPPTRCGLATFTEALASAMPGPRDPNARVVRVDDLVPTGAPRPGARTVIVADLRPGDVASRAAAAAELNACDVVIAQHEYGIYGGRDGDEILDLLDRVTAPTIVVLHTVRESPTAHQRWLLDRVAGMATAVVVMTHTAAELLATTYAVDGSRVHVIPHGVAVWGARPPTVAPDRPLILSWGLLGPGKGLEWGIRAIAELGGLDPRPRYLIAGQTHPKVVAESGEGYRASLEALAAELGVGGDVLLDDRYRDLAELAALVASASLVLLPYDSREQTTSGVLAEAVAAGKPVIATRFPHAVELLSGGAGVLIGHEDPHQIAVAIRSVLGRHELAESLGAAALEETHLTTWSAVAERYRALAAELLNRIAA